MASTRARPTPSRRSSTPSASSTTRRCSPTPHVQPPKTLEELKTAAAAIKAKTGKTGLYLRGDDSYWFLPFIYGEGGDLVDAKTKRVTVDNAAGIKAFKAARDLVTSGAAVTNATDGWTNMQTAFKSGEAAMMINGPWAVADSYAGDQFKDKANLGVAPVPAYPSRRAPRRAATTSPSTPVPRTPPPRTPSSST